MNMRRHLMLYGLLLLFAAALPVDTFAQTANGKTAQRHLIMVSFDGFRSDYAERWNLPHFKRLAAEGAAARSMIPVYPSKTFPNHYSLVTGLYPGNHGLIDNSFFSRATGKRYSIGDRTAVEDPRYYGGTPLWQHLQQHGIRSASYFWVGSEAPIQGQYPDYYHRYDDTVRNDARVEQVLAWLALPDAERPRFVTLYFSLVDSIAHATGPESAQTRDAALRADQLLGMLMDGIRALPVAVDLLVVSDHGMYPVPHVPERYIDASALGMNEDIGMVVISQAQAQLYLHEPDRLDAVYQMLRRQEKHFTVYRKQDTPPHWRYAEHANIGDILVVAEPGYVITAALEREFGAKGNAATDTGIDGVHGYDARDVPELHGIFYAWGPTFRAGSKLEPFENIHVFPLITHYFGVPDPAAIDGDARVLMQIIRSGP